MFELDFDRIQDNKKKIDIQIPVSVLVFCAELDLSEEEFTAQMESTKLLKKSLDIVIDATRIASPQKLKELFESSNLLKIYKASELSKGLIYAGTKFEHKVAKSSAFIMIDTKSGKLEVHGEKQQFIDSIIKDLYDSINK